MLPPGGLRGGGTPEHAPGTKVIMSIADWSRGGIAGGLTPITVLDLSPYPCDCNALQFRRTIVLRVGAQRSSPFAQSTAGLQTARFGVQSRATSRGG